MLIVFVMVLGVLPAVTTANTPASEAGTVYISISDDSEFITDAEGNPMGFVPVSLEEVAWIDLTDYYLEEYIYDNDNDGVQDISALHLYIYVHEVLLGLDWLDVSVSGSPGSIYLPGGLFGFPDENLRYDLNGSYPINEQLSQEYGYAWGATADCIFLEDGDFLNIAHYTDWSFWGDSATGFHYFTNAEDTLQHTYQVPAGEPLEMKLVRSFSDWSNGGAAAFAPEMDFPIYYGKTYGQAEGCVYSDSEGLMEITFPSAGTWYVWTSGGYGAENPQAIVSAPAFATVIVPDLEFTVDLSAVKDPLYDGGILAYNTNDLAYFDDNADAGKTTKYAFSTENYDQYIVYLDFYTDSTIIGFQVNGVSYYAEDPGEGYIDYEIAPEIYTGFAFGYTDENDNEYTEFYLQLGLDAAYKTSGSWTITPLVLTDAVLNTIDAIDDIYANGPEITLDSGDAILYATQLYNALTDTEKEIIAYFEMLELLEDAQEAYSILRDDQDAADAVIAQINAIGTVTLSSEAAITQARAAYDTLTDAQKALVSNYSVLTAAESALEALKKAAADQQAADEVIAKIADIGTVSYFSNKKISTARSAYNALTDDQKALVSNVSVLTAAEAALAEIYAQAANTNAQAIYEATGSYIAGLGTPGVGSVGGEWMVIDLVRAGKDCPEGYYDAVIAYVQANINDKEQLHRNKSTENSRLILALTAAGYDVTDVDGHNLLMGLTDMAYLPRQGINGPVWALIAFDCHNYEIPVNPNASEQVTREKLIAYILDKQLADGGWAMSGQAADPDMTGMAIQALAPYYATNAEVKEAVDKALDCLSSIQQDNGGFGSIDGVCTESSAQVIVALIALGIDPETDSRFIKNGISVVDAMCQFAIPGGGFAHVPNDTLNGMATEQGQYALVAYFRFKNGQTSLYDMSDVTIGGPAQTGDNSFIVLSVTLMVASVICLATLILINKKKYTA